MIHGTLAVDPCDPVDPCPLSSPVVHGFQGAGNGTCKTPENTQD